MWKYVAFVLLIVFSVPAVFGQTDEKNDTAFTNGTDLTVGNSTVAGLTTTVITTTIAAATTTETPTTSSTETPTTSSTETPTTSSTEAPTTTPESTTSKVTTVPPPPTPTALPPPEVGKHYIHEEGDKNKTCLMVQMALRVSILDPQGVYNFPGNNASTDGSSCNVSNTQVLKLTAEDLKQTLTFIFVQEDKKNYVRDIIFSYTPEHTVNTSGHYFSAGEGNSYLCNSDEEVKMENVTLTFSSVQIQAYGADKIGRAEECAADDKVGDVVPIAVGCALGALVIIVLIAYLVGRRRSHQRGYQSV